MCKIMSPKGHVIATIPYSDGLYRVTATKSSTDESYAAATSGKMMISEAHRKLGHISCRAISHAISKGYITGIELEANSKPEFCEVCAKAKAARRPFPKESDTRATKYSERVHWDLWGPATVKSLNGHHYWQPGLTTRQEKQSSIFKKRRVKRLTLIKRMRLTLKLKPATG
jgi:GAG-pre-integrase domain